jgi:SMI1 / KNR4 family (SUKH-1)
MLTRHDLLMVIDWRTVLASNHGNQLRPSASAAELDRAEALLGAVFPDDLRGLYLATDGVFDKPGQWFVVWPLAEVVMRNRQAWAAQSTARQGFVGFGDDGTGAPFCVPRDGSIGVFTWNPIEQRADRLAATVEQFWSGWSGGEIRT